MCLSSLQNSRGLCTPSWILVCSLVRLIRPVATVLAAWIGSECVGSQLDSGSAQEADVQLMRGFSQRRHTQRAEPGTSVDRDARNYARQDQPGIPIRVANRATPSPGDCVKIPSLPAVRDTANTSSCLTPHTLPTRFDDVDLIQPVPRRSEPAAVNSFDVISDVSVKAPGRFVKMRMDGPDGVPFCKFFLGGAEPEAVYPAVHIEPENSGVPRPLTLFICAQLIETQVNRGREAVRARRARRNGRRKSGGLWKLTKFVVKSFLIKSPYQPPPGTGRAGRRC